MTPKQKADELVGKYGIKSAMAVAREVSYEYTEVCVNNERATFWIDVRVELINLFTKTRDKW